MQAVLQQFLSPKLLAGAAFGTVGILTYNDYTRYVKMSKQFARGNVFGPLSNYETTYFKRPALESTLTNILKPSFTHSYYVINGEVGTGKTRSLVEITKREIDKYGSKGQGAPVYVLLSQGFTFTDTLAKAVGFNFDEHINMKYLIACLIGKEQLPSSTEETKLNRVLQAIEQAAFYHKKIYDRPAVLIIDGLDMLMERKRGSSKIGQLQEKAKLWADTNICKVVFVTNSKNTIDLLQENKSCWSRAAQPIHVGDFTDDESMSYLTNTSLYNAEQHVSSTKHYINNNTATKIHKLVGGRIQHLKAFKFNMREGLSYEETARMLISKEREKFTMVSRTPEMWKAINLLNQSKEKTVPLVDLVDQTSLEAIDALENQDIIKLQRSKMGMLVKFQSKLTVNVVIDMKRNYDGVASFMKSTLFSKMFLNAVFMLLLGRPASITEMEVIDILSGDE